MRRDAEQLANVFVDCRHAYLVDVLVKRFDSRNGTCRQAFKIAAAHVAKPASEIHHGNASIDDAVGKMPDANGVGRACASASIAADAKREQALLVLRSWRTKKVPFSGKGFYRPPSATSAPAAMPPSIRLRRVTVRCSNAVLPIDGHLKTCKSAVHIIPPYRCAKRLTPLCAGFAGRLFFDIQPAVPRFDIWETTGIHGC